MGLPQAQPGEYGLEETGLGGSPGVLAPRDVAVVVGGWRSERRQVGHRYGVLGRSRLRLPQEWHSS